MIAALPSALLIALAAPAAAAPTAPAPAPAPAAAPASGPTPSCGDDRGTDRCAPDAQQRLRDAFGVGTIERHQEAGDQVRRVFYVDGYGRDLLLIAFVRTAGREPWLVVRFPRREGEPAAPPIEVPVPRETWEEVLRRSDVFDRKLAPSPTDPAALDVCMHSWVYTVEAADPAMPPTETGKVRRRTEDSCTRGLASAYARDIERLALPLVPWCAALDPAQHRNPATQLSDCRLLRGDRLAAAEVLNRAAALRQVENARDVAGLFDFRATVRWDGTERPTDLPAHEYWARRAGEGGGTTNFFFESVEGLSPYRVRLTGSLVRASGEPTVYARARVELDWTYASEGAFMIRNAVVGPWQVESQR